MGMPNWQVRESNCLLQLGVLLLLFSMLLGIVLGTSVSAFSTRLLGLSAHLIALLEGLFLLLIGLLWPKLKLTRRASQIAFWIALYSCLVGSLASVFVAVSGADCAMRIAAQKPACEFGEDIFIQAIFYTVAVTTIALMGFILWGLRAAAAEQTRDG